MDGKGTYINAGSFNLNGGTITNSNSGTVTGTDIGSQFRFGWRYCHQRWIVYQHKFRPSYRLARYCCSIERDE